MKSFFNAVLCAAGLLALTALPLARAAGGADYGRGPETDPVAYPVATNALAKANAASTNTLIAVTATNALNATLATTAITSTNVAGYSLMTNTVIYLDASTNVATNTTFYLGR